MDFVTGTNSDSLVASIKAKALQLGFDLVGISSAEPSSYRQRFRQWLDDGQAGQMTFLADRFSERVNPAVYFPGARSVICVAINYNHTRETSTGEIPGRIARYADGDDYHEIIKDRLHDLADWLRETVPGTRTRSGVDTVPVVERELAARAGIGWIGKNTCIIHPRLGSWLLLGEVLTTLSLPADAPEADHCGSCTRCIDACPTQAITAPWQLDARRCISYLTIEHRKGEIPVEHHQAIGDWLFGCDICQEVCPFNAKAPTSTDPDLLPRFTSGTLDAKDVMNWSVEDYQRIFRGSAIKRVKLPVLQRNARAVIENQQLKQVTRSVCPTTPPVE